MKKKIRAAAALTALCLLLGACSARGDRTIPASPHTQVPETTPVRTTQEDREELPVTAEMTEGPVQTTAPDETVTTAPDETVTTAETGTQPPETSPTEEPSPIQTQPVPAGEGNSIFDDVGIWDGLSLLICDGETCLNCNFYRDYRKVIYALQGTAAVPAPEFTADMMTFPVYEIHFARKDPANGSYLSDAVLWTNGYLIDSSGNAWRFPYDFAQLAQEDWEDRMERSGGLTAMKCARFVTEKEGAWLFDRLPEAEAPEISSGMEMEVKEVTEKAITVTLGSKSDEELIYGEQYRLDVYDGEKWRQVSLSPYGQMFDAVGRFLPAGGTVSQEYGLFGYVGAENEPFAYYPLPAGHYRIVIPEGVPRGVIPGTGKSVVAEFDIP